MDPTEELVLSDGVLWDYRAPRWPSSSLLFLLLPSSSSLLPPPQVGYHTVWSVVPALHSPLMYVTTILSLHSLTQGGQRSRYTEN